jgi:hypothetical protein
MAADGVRCIFDAPCTPTPGGLAPVADWLAWPINPVHSACLAEDAAESIGGDSAEGSTTILLQGAILTLDCARYNAADAVHGFVNARTAHCAVRDRIHVTDGGAVYLHNLRFADLVYQGSGGALAITSGAIGVVAACLFQDNRAAVSAHRHGRYCHLDAFH